MRNELSRFFNRLRPAIQSSLENLLPASDVSPSQIHEAMRYATLDGGKRIRPALCVAAYSVAQNEWREDWSDGWSRILPVAAAIELIHTYSLIHDDLPAMDNDDQRRGRPACHRKFDEAIAILAGDALLTLGFEILARVKEFPPDRMLQIIVKLAAASGTRDGMIAGQVLDLAAEGRTISPAELECIHRSKTGALIGGAVWSGAYLGGASGVQLESISTYGELVGLAFQVLDDIDDELEGKGRDHGKATYPATHGVEKSRAIAQGLLQAARQALEPLGDRSSLLTELCDYLEHR